MVPQSPETCLWLAVAQTSPVLIERQKRMSRVRFKHPIRVVTLEGQPRVIRTLTANVSREGLFLRMPAPLPMGTKVALSLEAGGRALALAQAEVVWGRVNEGHLPGHFPGCGVRFTEFMHPRAEELVQYLVHNLDRGKPLMLAPPERRWTRFLPLGGGAALLGCAALAALVLWAPSNGDLEAEDAPASIELVAQTPTVTTLSQRGEQTRPSALELPMGAVVTAPEATVAKNPNVAMTLEPRAAPAENAPEATVNAKKSKPPAVVATPEPRAAPAENVPEATVNAKKSNLPAVVASAQTSNPGPPVSAKNSTAAAEAIPALKKSVAPLAAAKPPTASPSLTGPSQRGTITLPSGAASSLKWVLTGTELRLSPERSAGAQLTRAFLLTGPPRAVFDLSGAAPERSHAVAAAPPYATAVRLGKPVSGTRLVVDLDSAPKRSRQDGDALVLSF